MRRLPHILALAGALLGTVLAALSSYDFAKHLDRQVHALHCGFGASGPNVASGCKVAMMSSYSSLFRGAVWGGVPVALPAMALFAFLAFAVVETWVSRRDHDARSMLLLMIAAAVPLLASLVMGSISIFSLGSACTVCIGIYLASGLCFAGALMLWLRARRAPVAPVAAQAPIAPAAAAKSAAPAKDTTAIGHEPAWVGELSGDARDPSDPALAPTDPLPQVPRTPPQQQHQQPAAEPASVGYLAGMTGIAVASVLLVVVTYIAGSPDQSRFAAGCGQLESAGDKQRVLVSLPRDGLGADARSAIEVLDPLCPACAAFEQRLRATGFEQRLARRVLLFPLESGCNWMVERTLHPGACAISEAVLCAGDGAPAADVIQWAFANQKAIMDATRADKDAAKRMVAQRFPRVARCVGTPKARARLNRALRWAVKNHLPVLTPQLYVGGVQVCNEDLDIGLDYTLSRMLKRRERGGAR
ncbi:MAG: hypothetical protein KC503_11530 [Myxococcales bacterium]|nr:hypothetical protein [Myxococcales bacterium]